MKLSMWIIADELECFETILSIKEGANTISGIRLFSVKKSNFTTEYLYIDQTSNVISDKKYCNSVILVHKYDMIIVMNQDIETVINKLLSIIDFYNSWELSLREAAASKNALQRIFDLSSDILPGPAYASDRVGNVLALTGDCPTDERNELWDAIRKSGSLPLDMGSSMLVRQDGAFLGDWSPKPEIYFLDNGVKHIGMHILMDNEPVMGFCVIEMEKELKQSDLQKVGAMYTALETAVKNQENITAISSNALLSNAIKGATIDSSVFESLCGTKIKKPWKIISARHTFTKDSPSKHTVLFKTVASMSTASISTIFNDDVVILISADSLEGFLQELPLQTIQTYFTVGISLPFYDAHELITRYEQTQFIIGESNGTSGIYKHETYAFKHLISIIKENSKLSSLAHYSLNLLKHYDSQHSADLYTTLYYYLKNERNAVKTAEELNIHRNTMNSRLKKFGELLPDIDLNSPDTREHIVLSYLLKLDTDISVTL